MLQKKKKSIGVRSGERETTVSLLLAHPVYTQFIFSYCYLKLTFHPDPHKVGRMISIAVGCIDIDVVDPSLGEVVRLLLRFVKSCQAHAVSVIEVPPILGGMDRSLQSRKLRLV